MTDELRKSDRPEPRIEPPDRAVLVSQTALAGAEKRFSGFSVREPPATIEADNQGASL
jgi:hypothetical protein